MPGTEKGGRQASKTIINLYGSSFFRDIGRLGGSKSRTGGFYANPEAASKWGKIGGTISRRGDTPKPNKKQITEIRKRLLEEQSQMQTTRLSAKFGSKRPW